MTAPDTRPYWVAQALKIANPVFEALAAGRLRATMPIEEHPQADGRSLFTHLEALGRCLTGIAPWFEAEGLEVDEANRRETLRQRVLLGLDRATDPRSPDFMNFTNGHQPLVDAAFLAHGLLRSWDSLWQTLDEPVRRKVISSLKATRTRKPAYCNWLLFSGIIEAFLARAGEADWDRMRVDYAIRQHNHWYKGDGVYGDGPDFHWDYYNSYVIQPMLIDILEAVGPETDEWEMFREGILKRAVRYAAVQERMIAPDGSFPPLGRSLCYRGAAFQLLAQIALRGELPDGVSPGQVRGALSAVLQRTLEPEGTFDAGGWLRIGLAGHQPGLGETYISTGSLYLCCAIFLPLGLSPESAFWSAPAGDWTSRKIWRGHNLPYDHALHGT
jgi:hypothetical protein